MKQLRYILTCITLLNLFTIYSCSSQSAHFFYIPTQTLDLYKIIGENSETSIQTIKQFQISSFVTFKEYKEYLKAIKKDSTQAFYLSQLPDTSIGTKEVWAKYVNDIIYDKFPVLGISWENAMNFCKWKTLNDNQDSIQFIYRLPRCNEWLAAFTYLKDKKKKNDFNKNYSDWLINSKDETSILFFKKWHYDWTYFHKENDPPVLKRKQVIGNSYLYQQQRILNYSFSFYANEGYKQVGFRYVIDSSYQADILKYWGLK